MATVLTPITASIPDFTVNPVINTATFPEDIDVYNSELPTVITAQDLLGTQINILIPQLNTLENNVGSLEASTQFAADIAIAVSNFQGTWTNQLTSIPQSWLYAGVVYMVLVPGTASPITTPSNWFAVGTASSTTFIPSGDIVATNVQSAIVELDTEKAPKASPTFTGTVVLPSTTSIGTITNAELSYLGGVTSGIQTQFTAKAPLVSPTLTGTPTAPTAVVGTNTTQIATTAFVQGVATSANIQLGTAVTASGAAVDFIGIPAGVKRVTVMFNGVSTSGATDLLVRIGNGAVVTTGYSANSFYYTMPVLNTTGFICTAVYAAADLVNGRCVIDQFSDFIYNSTHSTSVTAGQVNDGNGKVTLSSAIDRVRITTVSGTETFDAGTINISWEF